MTGSQVEINCLGGEKSQLNQKKRRVEEKGEVEEKTEKRGDETNKKRIRTLLGIFLLVNSGVLREG